MAERGAAGQKRAEDAAGCPVGAGVLWHNVMCWVVCRAKLLLFALILYIRQAFYCVFVGKSGAGMCTKLYERSCAVLRAASRSLPLCPPALAGLRMAGVSLAADKFWCDNSYYGCGDRFWFAVAHCRLLGMRLCLAAMSLVFRKRSGPCSCDGAMIA